MKNTFFRMLNVLLIFVLTFCFIAGCSSNDEDVDSYSSYSDYSYDDYSSSSTSGCEYESIDGSICGAPVGSNGVFCTKHKQELDDTYNDLLETLEGLE